MGDSIPPGMDLTKTPMAANPSGAPPNFDHGESLAGAVKGVGITMAVITFVLLAIRLRVYVQANRKLNWDDTFLLIAYGLALEYTIVASTLGRLSKHTWDTAVAEVNVDYMKKLFASGFVVGPMNFFAKTAILMLYHRVFHVEVWMRRTCWVLGIIFVGAYWQTVPLYFVYCMPRAGHPWDAGVLANCAHLKIPGFVHGGINCVADIVLFILPLPVIAKLHVNATKKFAISAIFGSALLGLVCSVLGIYYRVMISYGSDPVWSNAQAWIVIQGEVYVAICVACAPCLAKFWTMDFNDSRVYKTIMSLLYSTRRGTKQGSYPSTQGSRGRSRPTQSSESVSALNSTSQKHPGHSFKSIHDQDGYEMMHDLPARGEVRRETKIVVTSQARGHDMV